MRTTLTLDEDVAAKLVSLARRSGRAFRHVVNDTLRRGLLGSPVAPSRRPFRVKARDTGGLRAGISVDNVAELIEQVEGPQHR